MLFQNIDRGGVAQTAECVGDVRQTPRRLGRSHFCDEDRYRGGPERDQFAKFVRLRQFQSAEAPGDRLGTLEGIKKMRYTARNTGYFVIVAARMAGRIAFDMEKSLAALLQSID